MILFDEGRGPLWPNDQSIIVSNRAIWKATFKIWYFFSTVEVGYFWQLPSRLPLRSSCCRDRVEKKKTDGKLENGSFCPIKHTAATTLVVTTNSFIGLLSRDMNGKLLTNTALLIRHLMTKWRDRRRTFLSSIFAQLDLGVRFSSSGARRKTEIPSAKQRIVTLLKNIAFPKAGGRMGI